MTVKPARYSGRIYLHADEERAITVRHDPTTGDWIAKDGSEEMRFSAKTGRRLDNDTLWPHPDRWRLDLSTLSPSPRTIRQ